MRTKRKRINFRLRQKDLWFIKELEKIIETKSYLGFNTNIGNELVRFAILGFTGTTLKEVREDAKIFGINREQAMYVRIELLHILIEFLESRYGTLTKIRGELARWMTVNGLLWIKEPPEGATEVKIQCSDKELLNILEKDFYAAVEFAVDLEKGEE